MASQILAFVVMVGAGLVVGLMFDVYRVIRVLVRPRAVGGVLMDLAFWVVTTPALFVMLLIGNWGELRLYVFLGVGLGLFVYFQLASPLVLWGLVTYIRWLGRILAVMLHAALRLFGALVRCYRQIHHQLRCLKRPRPMTQRRPLARVPWLKRGAGWGGFWPLFRR